MGKYMLNEGDRTLDHELDGRGRVVPGQHQTVCLDTESAENKETFDCRSRAPSVMGLSETCVLEKPPPSGAQGNK